MLTDKQIQRICLVIAIIGVIGIAMIGNSEPRKVKIGEVTENSIGQIVEVSGTIYSYSTKDGHIFIQLGDDTGRVNIVMFEQTARTQKGVYNITKGMNATISGKVLLYRNELELQADIIEPKL